MTDIKRLIMTDIKDNSEPVVIDTADDFYKLAYLLAKRLASESVSNVISTVRNLQKKGIDAENSEDVKYAEELMEQTESDISDNIINMIKLVCNEYHCSVKDGLIKPYTFTRTKESGYEEFRDALKEEIKDATIELAMIGVPFKEGDGGNLKIDYDAMDKIREERKKDSE